MSLIKMIWDWVKNKNIDVNGRIESIEKAQDEILTSIRALEIYMAQVKDSMVNESAVRKITRDEIEYRNNVQKKRSIDD